MTSVPVLTIANARRSNPMAGVRTTREFAQRVAAVPWFSRLGQPSEWDPGAVRIREWSEWPGPEDPNILDLALANQAIYDALQAAAADLGRADDAERVFHQLHELAHTYAREGGVPFDPEMDAWHAPTQCVEDAAYCAGLIGGFFELEWSVPEDLGESWAWFQRGHWPCGFADEPSARPRTLRVL